MLRKNKNIRRNLLLCADNPVISSSSRVRIHVLGLDGWQRYSFGPALLALNVGVVVGLIILTLLLGRVYCSVICPLGVLQDIISWFASKTEEIPFFRFSCIEAGALWNSWLFLYWLDCRGYRFLGSVDFAL